MSRLPVICLLPSISLAVAFSGCGSDAGTTTTASAGGSATTTDSDSTGESVAPIFDAAALEEAIVAGNRQNESEANSDDVAGTGTLRGIVTFKGDVPEPQVIQATKDPEVCSAGEGAVTDVVVKDGKLVGAVVELSIKGKELPEFKAPKDGFVIRQKDCLFSPRLVVAYSGAEFTIHNDDKVEHNVNTGNWNLLQSPGGPPIMQKMKHGANPFTRVTCNIHSWMESWVYLARSPFYAASNDAGEFVIEGIPVGTKIRGVITHATLGKQRFTVDIAAGQPTEQDFEFEAK